MRYLDFKLFKLVLQKKWPEIMYIFYIIDGALTILTASTKKYTIILEKTMEDTTVTYNLQYNTIDQNP
jgi:hypothetical protein